MKKRKERISQRLDELVRRLRDLENKPVEEHERPMAEVGILALRERIASLARQLRGLA